MVCALAAGDHRSKRLSLSQTFSYKLDKTPTSRYTQSMAGRVPARRLTSPETHGTMSPVRGRNLWARERVKAHTRRCREHHIIRQNFERVTHKRDSTADDLFDAGDELATDSDKLLLGELTVDTALVGNGSTPKSSPASFSDVSITPLNCCFSQLWFCLKQRLIQHITAVTFPAVRHMVNVKTLVNSDDLLLVIKYLSLIHI